MHRIRLIALAAIIFIIAVGVGSFLLPMPGKVTNANFHGQLLVTLFIGLSHLAAAMLFILGLPSFKVELRKAYNRICAGIIVLGVSQLLYPIFIYLGVQDVAFYSISSLLAILADFLIFWGLVRFAKILVIHSPALSWLVMLVTVVTLSGLSTALPHAASQVPEQAFDVSQALYITSVVIIGFSTYVVLLIKRATSAAYGSPLRWFIVGLLSSIIALLLLIAANLVGPSYPGLAVLAIVPFVAAGAFLMRAGYVFNTIGSYGDSVSKFHGEVSLVDIVVYVAAFASSPHEVDPLLDDMRAITSALKPNEKPSAADQARLAAVYRSVEQYLVTREPLRKLDTATVRRKVALEFHFDPSPNSSLWPMLGVNGAS